MAIDAAVPCMGLVYPSPYNEDLEQQYQRGIDGQLDATWRAMIDPRHASKQHIHCLQSGQGLNNQSNTFAANRTRAAELQGLTTQDAAPPANETRAKTVLADTSAITVRFKMQVRLMTPNHTADDGSTGSGDYKVTLPKHVVLEGGNSSATADGGKFVDGWDRLPQQKGPFVDPTTHGNATNFTDNVVWPMQQVGPSVASTATSPCCLHTNNKVDALEDYWVVPSSTIGLDRFGRSVHITTAHGCLRESTVGCAPLAVVGGWDVGAVFQVDGGQLVADIPTATRLRFSVNISRRVESLAGVRSDTLARIHRGNVSQWVSASASTSGLAVFVLDQ